MVSKSSAPHSIRFRNELWDRVCARAKRDGMTPNEAVIALVTAGLTEPPIKLQRVRPGVTIWPSGVALEPHHAKDPAAEAAHVSVPLHKPKPFNPQPKKGKK